MAHEGSVHLYCIAIERWRLGTIITSVRQREYVWKQVTLCLRVRYFIITGNVKYSYAILQTLVGSKMRKSSFWIRPYIHCEPQFELSSSLTTHMACTVSLTLIDGRINFGVCNSTLMPSNVTKSTLLANNFCYPGFRFFLRKVFNGTEISV